MENTFLPQKNLIQRMHELYGHKISEVEAIEAAENLVRFCKILLEESEKQAQNQCVEVKND